MASVYVIRNTVNDKVYVGTTTETLHRRFGQHKRAAMRGNTECRMYDAMRLFGIDKFFIEELENCDSSISHEREGFWIGALNTIKNGYNSVHTNRAIIMLNLKGEIISEFKSITHLCKELGVYTNEVHDCFNGKQFRLLGNIIMYKDTYSNALFNTILEKAKASRQVDRGRHFNVYKDGVLVETFNSRAYCAEYFNLIPQRIGQCLLGRQKEHKGYTFNFVE